MLVSVNKFMINGPTFKELPILLSSELFGVSDNLSLSQTMVRDKFMQIQVKFDEFTNKLREIHLKFKRLTVAWKVDLIQKILSFLNIDINSLPTLPSRTAKKR